MISRQLVNGDVVVFTADVTAWDMTKGKEYQVRKDDDGDFYIRDDGNDKYWISEEYYEYFALKEDGTSPGYINIREWEQTPDEPTVMTLEVDEEGFETIIAIAKRSEVNGQRRLLEEQIATLQKRLEALGNA